MVLKTAVLVLMTLVTLTQLAECLSTASNQSDDPGEQSSTTMLKKADSPYLYVIGGAADPTLLTSLTNSSSRLATATGEWKAMRDMPTARSHFCGAVVGKKIYLFGGYETLNFNNSKLVSKLASNDAYDYMNDAYMPLSPIPHSQRVDCAAAALGQSIYVSGGKQPSIGGGFCNLDSLLRYDTQTNQWTTLSQMIKWRSAHQLIELDGLLYAIGGDWDGNSTEVYNATTNKWSEVAKTHYSMDQGGSAASHEGKIYYLRFRGFEVYSPETDQWNNLTRPEQSGEWFSSRQLVSMNGKLWAVGGKNGIVGESKLTLIENLHSYDPSTDQWTKEQKIDVGRTGGFSAFVVNP